MSLKFFKKCLLSECPPRPLGYLKSMRICPSAALGAGQESRGVRRSAVCCASELSSAPAAATGRGLGASPGGGWYAHGLAGFLGYSFQVSCSTLSRCRATLTPQSLSTLSLRTPNQVNREAGPPSPTWSCQRRKAAQKAHVTCSRSSRKLEQVHGH